MAIRQSQNVQAGSWRTPGRERIGERDRRAALNPGQFRFGQGRDDAARIARICDLPGCLLNRIERHQLDRVRKNRKEQSDFVSIREAPRQRGQCGTAEVAALHARETHASWTR